jgi:hypothetical protein
MVRLKIHLAIVYLLVLDLDSIRDICALFVICDIPPLSRRR